MIDYGLIAYNRTEDYLRNMKNNNINQNYFKKKLLCNCNQKKFIANLRTNINELISFKIKCELNVICEFYVNNELFYRGEINDGYLECGLYLSGISKLELKFINVDNIELLNSIIINGKFEINNNINNYFYYTDNSNLTLINKYNLTNKIISSNDNAILLNKFNKYNWDNFNGEFICGNYFENVFHFITKINNDYWLDGNIKLNLKNIDNSIMYIHSNSIKPIKLISLFNGKLTLYELDFIGNVNQVKINMIANLYIKEIYDFKGGANYNNNFDCFLILDTLNKSHIVLCDYAKIVQNSVNINILSLSKECLKLDGYYLDLSNIAINFKTKIGILNIVFAIDYLNFVIKKVKEKFYYNADELYLNANTNSLIQYKDYLSIYD